MIRYPAIGSWFQIIVVGNEAEQLSSGQEADEEAVHTVVGQEAESTVGGAAAAKTPQVPQMVPPAGQLTIKISAWATRVTTEATQCSFQEVICHTQARVFWISSIWKQLNFNMSRLFFFKIELFSPS